MRWHVRLRLLSQPPGDGHRTGGLGAGEFCLVAPGCPLRAWSQASSPKGAATRCSWVQNTVIQPPFQWSRTQIRDTA